MADKNIDQSGQTVEGNQVNVGGDANIGHVGDTVAGDKVAGDKIVNIYQEKGKEEIPPQKFEPEMVFIPAGPFLMGRQGGEGVSEFETPQHEVTLPAFSIGRFPVTHRLYERFIRENKHIGVPKDAGWFNRKPPQELMDHPMFGLSWEDAMTYCAWLTERTGRDYRLTSEAEWEKAACWTAEADPNQAPQSRKRIYPWGNEWLDGRCNVAGTGTTAVFDHPHGAGAYGVQDLLGNVQEWTRSLWGSETREPEFTYPYDPQDGREVATVEVLPPQMRVIHRGGSYKSPANQVSNTRRSHAASSSCIDWRGFRVVMAIAAE